MTRLLFYIFLLTGYFTSSCKKDMPAPDNSTNTAAEIKAATGHKYTYLALGDSYTIGESVPESDRWGVLLAGLLRAKNIDVSNPVTIARTGWTTAELSQAIKNQNITQTFDLVSLLIGVNNQYRGQSLESYRTEFRQLLQTSVTFAKNNPANVIVLSIPDWGATPFAQSRDRTQIAREIDAFNAVAREETKQAGIVFIDINPISKKALNDVSYVASDGLHYSGKMHLEWAQMALPEAEKILK